MWHGGATARGVPLTRLLATIIEASVECDLTAPFRTARCVPCLARFAPRHSGGRARRDE
jgi:hypothetical protein